MPNPVIWGISAALLNYIPYIGPAINMAIVLAVSLLTFNNLGAVLLPPALLLLLNIIEGQFVQPIFAGRMFIINPILIFISVLFWGWLWGVAGVFLAVPILMILKISIDHTRLYLAEHPDVQIDS
jgi:predicted PurR-regulated permease PerM